MLTTKNVSAPKAARYYVQEYYQQGQSRWFGKGAEKLGLQGEVNDVQVFKNLIQGLSPDGSKKLFAKSINVKERRAAVDCTFSAPKSVSITAFGAEDYLLLQAQTIATEKVLKIIERDYACTRVTSDGSRVSISAGNLIVAQFDHWESRNLDPHLHTHCLVMNAVETADGKWYSHQNDKIYQDRKYLGMLYQHYLALEVRKLGYEIEFKGNGQFEIKGYTPEQLKDFSQRRKQILAATEPDSSWLEREKAWAVTRKCKEKIEPQELIARWQEEAKALGIEWVKPGEPKLEPTALTQKMFDDAIAHCSERQVAFQRKDLEQFILKEDLTCDLSQLDAFIQQSSDLRQIPDSDSTRFTTEAALQRELATIQLMQAGKGQKQAIATPELIASELRQTTLNAGQKQAVEMAATTNDAFVAWQGVAGAGKTYALKQFRQLAEARGYVVKGFAPSAKAAGVLEKEIGIEANTVARLLVSQPSAEIQPNRIWIVDEAGLLGAKDALTLLQRATAERARVILVGDTRQLSAVAAGNPFKSLQQAGIKTAYLCQSQRQKQRQLKQAVDLVAQGRVEEGFQSLANFACIEDVADADKAKWIVSDYMQLTPSERDRTLILAGTHRERLQIVEAIRSALKAEGSLETPAIVTQLRAKDLTSVQMQYTSQIAIGEMIIPLRNYKRLGLAKGKLYEVVGKEADRLKLKAGDGSVLAVSPKFKKAIFQPQLLEMAVGDRLRWTRNDPLLGKQNGKEFTVTAINGSVAQIVNQEGKTEQLDLSVAQHLDYAIVHTTYSSQGKTAERVLVAMDFTIRQESFYVAISRAKHELKLYTTDRKQLLKLAQQSGAKENPKELLQAGREQRSVAASSSAINTAPAPVTAERKPNAPIWQQPNSVKRKVIPLPVKNSPSDRKKPSEPFWTPTLAGKSPSSLDTNHWRELVEGSAIHGAIAQLNFRSLRPDAIEGEHQAWEYLMYSDKLERNNTGRLAGGILKRYAQIENGGWWCDAGVNPLCFSQLEPGTKPTQKLWGCYKPNTPRLDPGNPTKQIKYEHPPKTDLSIFLLQVPEEIATKIYRNNGIDPSQSDRDSGFWYCAWKYNLPITITEGAKKAACLLSQGRAAIGLPGIYAGYRSKNKQGNPIQPRLHEELAVFATSGRQVTFCFDYETRAKTQRNINIAISRTGHLMQRRGARVKVIDLPGPEKGVDDSIVARGPLFYEQQAQEAVTLKSWWQRNKERSHLEQTNIHNLQEDSHQQQPFAALAKELASAIHARHEEQALNQLVEPLARLTQELESRQIERATNLLEETTRLFQQACENAIQALAERNKIIVQPIEKKIKERSQNLEAKIDKNYDRVSELLKLWYEVAQALGRADKYLQRINARANSFARSQPSNSVEQTAMTSTTNLEGKSLKQQALEQLRNGELFLLYSDITRYQQLQLRRRSNISQLQTEIQQINKNIEELWQKHSSAESLTKASHILKQIELLIERKEQKDKQLNVEPNNLLAQEVDRLAQILNSPSIQERLRTFQLNQQPEAFQQQDRQLSDKRSQHHKGLSL